MEKYLTIAIVYLSVCAVLTFILKIGSSNLNWEKNGGMGVKPIIAGAIMLILGIILLSMQNSFDKGYSQNSFLTICSLCGAAQPTQLIFFMMLNKSDNKYSAASTFGIFGTICGLSCTVILYLALSETFKPSIDEDDFNVIADICIMIEYWYPYIMAVAIGIFCGNIYDRHKIIRYAALILAGLYIISNRETASHILGILDYDSKSILYNLTLVAPVIGWAIFLISFNFDPIDEPSAAKEEKSITNKQ